LVGERRTAPNKRARLKKEMRVNGPLGRDRSPGELDLEGNSPLGKGVRAKGDIRKAQGRNFFTGTKKEVPQTTPD